MQEIKRLKLGQHTFEGVQKLLVRIDRTLIIELSSYPTRSLMEQISVLNPLEEVNVQFTNNGEWKVYEGPFFLKENSGILVFNKM